MDTIELDALELHCFRNWEKVRFLPREESELPEDVFDGYCWLLWGRDSWGNRGKRVRLRMPGGERVAVQGRFRVGDRLWKLERVLRFREEETREEFRIQDLRVSGEAYRSFVNWLFPEKIFRQVCEQGYVMEKLPPLERYVLLCAFWDVETKVPVQDVREIRNQIQEEWDLQAALGPVIRSGFLEATARQQLRNMGSAAAQRVIRLQRDLETILAGSRVEIPLEDGKLSMVLRDDEGRRCCKMALDGMCTEELPKEQWLWVDREVRCRAMAHYGLSWPMFGMAPCDGQWYQLLR